MVMLSDFQSRNFGVRPDIIGDVIPKNVREIEESLNENKVCLAAALARARVRAYFCFSEKL